MADLRSAVPQSLLTQRPASPAATPEFVQRALQTLTSQEVVALLEWPAFAANRSMYSW